jgi:hypothetical protein
MFILRKCVVLLIYFSNLIYMYLHQGLKNVDIQEMIYHHFLLNLLKIEFIFAFVWKYCCENG